MSVDPSRANQQPRPGEGWVPITFCVPGAQKAATTTLHLILVRHPRIARPRTKELHFFDDERRDWESPDYSEYRSVRRRPRQRISGDATPTYLYWPRALERIRAYRPEMLFIASFRDPIERAFSQWTMHASRIPGYPPFEVAVQYRASGTVSMRDLRRGGRLRTHTLVDRGRYGAQLRRGLDLFPREQWLLLDFREVVADRDGVTHRITDFLGLPRFATVPQPRYSNPGAKITGEPVGAELVRRLAGTFAEDLADFAALSGVDVASWSTSRILTGELDAEELALTLSRKAGLL